MRYEGALRSPIYDLCRQTVTVYHACYNPFRVTRCVIHGAYFERKTVQIVDKSGGKSCDEFLLVIPNKNARRVAPALFIMMRWMRTATRTLLTQLAGWLRKVPRRQKRTLLTQRETRRRREVCPHPPLRRHLPPRGKAWRVTTR